MDLMEVMMRRRSVRAYRPDPIPQEMIDRLLVAAVHAPTAANVQPWAFGVIQNQALLDEYSGQIKTLLLHSIDRMPWLAQYRDHFADPAYHIFYHAPALIVIHSKSHAEIAHIDCALAAENLMLAACDAGLGTCWIGFAMEFLNTHEVKKSLGVPDEYSPIAPIIVGYPADEHAPTEKAAPQLLYRK